jgi:hypothetical protein
LVAGDSSGTALRSAVRTLWWIEPDPGTALEVSALSGMTVDVRRLFG